MSEVIALCLRCLQKSLLSISAYDYPILDEGTRFPASVIRATPYRRYWRKSCEKCGKRPMIIVEIPREAVESPDTYQLTEMLKATTKELKSLLEEKEP